MSRKSWRTRAGLDRAGRQVSSQGRCWSSASGRASRGWVWMMSTGQVRRPMGCGGWGLSNPAPAPAPGRCARGRSGRRNTCQHSSTCSALRSCSRPRARPARVPEGNRRAGDRPATGSRCLDDRQRVLVTGPAGVVGEFGVQPAPTALLAPVRDVSQVFSSGLLHRCCPGAWLDQRGSAVVTRGPAGRGWCRVVEDPICPRPAQGLHRPVGRQQRQVGHVVVGPRRRQPDQDVF